MADWLVVQVLRKRMSITTKDLRGSQLRLCQLNLPAEKIWQKHCFIKQSCDQYL